MSDSKILEMSFIVRNKVTGLAAIIRKLKILSDMESIFLEAYLWSYWLDD